MLSKCIENRQDRPVALILALYFARNLPHSRHGFTPHELLFLKPSPSVLSILKSLRSSDSAPTVNLPQFVRDLDNQLAYQSHHVKSALSSKHASTRLSKESILAAEFKIGDIVYKREPSINKCLEASCHYPTTATCELCYLVPSQENQIKGCPFSG